MSGLWCEHFQQYANVGQLLDGVFAQNDGYAFDTSAPPRAGATYLSCTSVEPLRLRRVFGAPKAGAGFGYRMFVAKLPDFDDRNTGCHIATFLSAGGLGQIAAYLGSDGSIIVARGPIGAANSGNGTQIGRSSPCITARTWQHIEAKIVPDPTAGTFEIRVNGVTVFNYTGNTDPNATAEVSQMLIQSPAGANYFGIADLHAWDTTSGNGPSDFAGNVGVLRRTLNADTATADWALSTGSTGYALLIDKSDASYVEADTTTLKSAFGAASLPAGVTGILYQQVSFRGQKTDAADCDVAPSMKSSSAETTVTGQAMTEFETWRWGIFGLDPNTSSAWTLANANASKAAITRTL